MKSTLSTLSVSAKCAIVWGISALVCVVISIASPADGEYSQAFDDQFNDLVHWKKTIEKAGSLIGDYDVLRVESNLLALVPSNNEGEVIVVGPSYTETPKAGSKISLGFRFNPNGKKVDDYLFVVPKL